MTPTTRYTRTRDGVELAYQVAGDGPRDLVYVPTSFSQVEQLWEEPRIARFFDQLSSFARVMMFDRRGTGLSERRVDSPTLEAQAEDVAAVMAAAGSERAALLAQTESGPMALLFAATHPELVSHLVLFATWARMTWAPDYDWAQTAEERTQMWDRVIDHWGEGPLGWMLSAQGRADDKELMAWFGKLERLAANPAAARDLATSHAYDVRDILPSIHTPALVMRRRDSTIDRRHSVFLADHLPMARYVELPGDDSVLVLGDADAALDEIEEFLTGSRHQRYADRVLATVLFTDIVDSTKRASDLGDRAWRELLAGHDETVRRQLGRFRGREVKTTGDGFLATFDGPARAIECARAVIDGVRPLGLEVRAGLHTGECELIGDDVGGLAVHIGARVAQAAGAGEVLVSSTVRDLVVGSGIAFEERGARELKGVPGEWRLFAVA
jgi:class 3 adenylate cyclase